MERPPVIVGTDPFSVFVQHRTQAMDRGMHAGPRSPASDALAVLVDLPVAATFVAIAVGADAGVDVRTSDGNHHRAEPSDHATEVLARELLADARDDLDAMDRDAGTALPSHRDVQITVVSPFGRRRTLVDLERFWSDPDPGTPPCVTTARRLVEHLERGCSFPLAAL